MKKQVRKEVVHFRSNDTQVPIVDFTIDNCEKVSAIIDTGSELSVFDKEFIRANKDKFLITSTKNKTGLIGMSPDNNNVVPVLYATTNISFNDGSDFYPVTGMVLDLSHIASYVNMKMSCILGSDWLSQTKAKLDFDKNVMIIKDDLSGK